MCRCPYILSKYISPTYRPINPKPRTMQQHHPRPGGGRQKERVRAGRKEQAKRHNRHQRSVLESAVVGMSRMAEVIHHREVGQM